MAELSKKISLHISAEDRQNLQSRIIPKKFGRPTDYIDIFVCDLDDTILTTIQEFGDYSYPPQNTGTLTNELIFDPINLLSELGYNSGVFKLKINIQRRKFINTSGFIFNIAEISPSRTELRVKTTEFSPEGLTEAFNAFMSDFTGALFFKDFILNFGQNVNVVGVNIGLDKVSPGKEHDLLIKLYEPLPIEIGKGGKFSLAENITNPIEYTIDLGDSILDDLGIPILGPNFRVDTRLNNPMSSEFKSYNDIMEGTPTSSLRNIQNALSSSIKPNVIYDKVRTVSGSNLEETEKTYHFENFIHFSSATERLKNFQYKLKLIENYNTQIQSINTITGTTSQSVSVLDTKEGYKSNISKIIQGLDGYERFLYFESGTYSWPKNNTSKPYELYSVSSSQAKIWIGNEIDTATHYGGQLLSASLYDETNVYNLEKTLPNHILDNMSNEPYKLFINMVGQYFDESWILSRGLTDIKNATNKVDEGLSRELLYTSLKNLGIEVFDQFENTNLFEYILGETKSGSVFYETPVSQSLITASNEGSIPKKDITQEVWKRIYHNVPYLLKTKGTERGIRALISCYGIPETILNIKEYSSQISPIDTPKRYKYEKFNYALEGDSGTGGYFLKTNWSSSLTPIVSAKTVEFRIKPYRSDDKYHLFSLSGSTYGGNISSSQDIHLVLTPNTGSDISSSGDYNQYGKLDLYKANIIKASTDWFPVYNGKYWNINISGIQDTVNLNSNGDPKGTSSFGAYRINQFQNIFKYTSSWNADLITQYWGLTTGTTDQGPKQAYIGGIPDNGHSAYDTVGPLRYSGSLQEVKYYFGEKLTDNTLKNHTLDPNIYSGNTTSSAYNKLIIRLPLGGNLTKTITSSYHPNQDISYLDNTISSSMSLQKFTPITNNVYLHYPNSAGNTLNSSKVRIDETSSIDNNILSPYIKAEESDLKDTIYDSNTLGIFFSPQHEINKDIIQQFGAFEIDDYIGDPKHQTSGSYPDLLSLKDEYQQKIKTRYNIFDYIKLIKQVDHTLFNMIEKFSPAKANLKTGITIESPILERNKISVFNPTVREETVVHGRLVDGIKIRNSISGSAVISHNNFEIDNGREIMKGTNTAIYITQSVKFDNTCEPLYGNFTDSRYSKTYYYQVLPYNQFYTGQLIDNSGNPISSSV
jgi:hypothetical protein